MKFIQHWNRGKINWQERMLWVDAPESAGGNNVEQSNDLDSALRNPLKFRMAHLREMERDVKNISPEQKKDFRDLSGYFLSLKQNNGSKKLPPQMLVQISKSPLFSMLSQKMQEQINNTLDKQLEELIDFSRKSIGSPSTAIRAAILYRRLRSQASNDDRLTIVFERVQKNLLEWSIDTLRKGSISSQVQQTLTGLERTGARVKKVSKQEKLIIGEIYRMFPQSEDWVDNCDAQSSRAFAIEAMQAIKENPSDPTMVLGWSMIDEWMAEENQEMISLLMSKFTAEELSQFIGRARAVELLNFAQKQQAFLPTHLQALKELKDGVKYLPQKYTDVEWEDFVPNKERINEISEKRELLKKEYEASREKEIERYQEQYPNNEEVVQYETALKKKEESVQECWDEQVSQLDELVKRWDNISKFESQAAEARRDTLAGKLHIVDEEKDLERKKKYQEDQDKYIENYKKQLEESLALFQGLQTEIESMGDADISEKEALIQKFQKHLQEKLPYATNYGVSAQPEEDVAPLRHVMEGLKKYEEEIKKNEAEKESAIQEMPFTKSFQEKEKKYKDEVDGLQKDQSESAKKLREEEEWNAIFSNPQEHAKKATDNFWKGIQGRLDRHQLHAADFEILWNDEFAEDVQENITNLPEFEKMQRFRDAFEKALDGIFDDIDLTDDVYETWYEALDAMLSYENLIQRVHEQGFDIQEEFTSPQKISEVLEGAITRYREDIFGMVKGDIAEEKHDEFYSNWNRLHGRLSAPVVDPTIISGEHAQYETEKMNADILVQSEQEHNISIIEGLEQKAQFSKDPVQKEQLLKEAEKLREAWDVRKKWYMSGGKMTVEGNSGEAKDVWAPGKKVLAEMSLQAGGVEKEIGDVLEKSIIGPLSELKESYRELGKIDSPAEKKQKQKEIRVHLESIFGAWPENKTKLSRLLKDHKTILDGLIPEGETVGFSFVKKIAEEGNEWLDTIDERIHVWKKDAKSKDYLYHGDEEVFGMLSAAAQSLRTVIDFNQGKYAQESERLDGYLEEDTKTVEFLEEENFFGDTSTDRKEFKSKYEEMAESFRKNIDNYKKQYGKVRSRLRKDLDTLNDDDFTERYKGIPRESMESLLSGHDQQLSTFQEGSGKFLSSSFFNNWLRRYGESPESRANALDEMSHFRSLDTWSEEASNQADSMETWVDEWENGSTKTLHQYQRFSLYDIYALVKQAVEVNRRRWERNSERAVAEIGVSFFGRNSPWGKEFYRKAQDAEETRVKELQTEMDEDPWWETQETLYQTNDADEAKACINLLIEKGVFRWDDQKLWKTLMRLSGNAVNFRESDKYIDFSEILEKCKNVIDFIWTRETFRQWDTTLESKIKSKEDEFEDDFQRLEHHETARVGFLTDVLTRWKRGERSNTDPAKYGCFIRKSFEKGKMNGGPLHDTRWYFLIQGVKLGILSRDFFGRLNGELLGQMPFFDFFVDKSSSKKDGRIVPHGTPGSEKRAWTYKDYELWADMLHKEGEPYTVDTARKRNKNFFYEVVLQSEEGRGRMERMVRNGTKTFDHDDAAMFAAGLGVESIRQMLNKTSTDEDKYTPDFWRNIMSGYVPYFNGISKFIREGDAEYGLQDKGWLEIRKRNFEQVADKMQAMLLVFHSVLGNINITNREPIHFSEYDFNKSEAMSPSAAKSLEASEKMLRNLLKGTEHENSYSVIFNKSEWLSPNGKIAPAKEDKTIAKKNGDGKTPGDPNHISVKLYDLIKGKEGRDVFSLSNVENFLVNGGGDISSTFEAFTSDAPVKKTKIVDLSGTSSSEGEGGNELGMTG